MIGLIQHDTLTLNKLNVRIDLTNTPYSHKRRYQMIIEELSKEYNVRRLTEAQVDEVFELCAGNPLYYEYHPPFITREAVIEDMKNLPPGKQLSDKYYLGFYQNNILIAVLDLIDGYPEAPVAFIGFFMTHKSIQGRGFGTKMIASVCSQLKKEGFRSVRLAWIKGNPQSEHFWLKNQFEILKETTSMDGYTVILAERKL